MPASNQETGVGMAAGVPLMPCVPGKGRGAVLAEEGRNDSRRIPERRCRVRQFRVAGSRKKELSDSQKTRITRWNGRVPNGW